MIKHISGLLLIWLLSLSAQAAIKGEEVSYKADDTTLKGYLAYDDAITGKRPAVLVVHEWWGHLDYIHINPVKHSLVTRVRDWPYSTFHRLVVDGVYAENWAGDIGNDTLPYDD